ncbi:MAG TPA: ROK family protein, partial [Rubrobacteraceae bacterium]
NLHAVEDIPLKDKLEPRIGLPLTLENDANAATWGEFRFGAGSEVDHLVFVALGTGIGGGVISHRMLVRGAQGSAGELGHVTIQASGPRCACGNRGCLEALASGTAIRRRARELASEHPGSALGRLAADREVLGEDVTRLAREGDGVAVAVLEEAGRWLGIGLAGFVNVFNPEVIAVGGGVMAAGELILEAAREEVRLRARPPSRELVQIKEATLGPNSGVLGAAALARDPSSGEYVLES